MRRKKHICNDLLDYSLLSLWASDILTLNETYEELLTSHRQTLKHKGHQTDNAFLFVRSRKPKCLGTANLIFTSVFYFVKSSASICKI